MRWVEYFRKLAHTVKLKSKDESTQIGAVIVGKDKEIVSTGYNSFPRGLKDYEAERQQRPEKYFWFEHAERNAIANAAKKGISTNEGKIYCSYFPCSDCAISIIEAGIRKLYTTEPDFNHHKWGESWRISETMFKESGVDVEYIDFSM